MDISADEDWRANHEKTAYEILLRHRNNGASNGSGSKALQAFVTSAAPDFFDNFQEALLKHLERLQELCDSGRLTPRDAAAAIAELIHLGRTEQAAKVPWATSEAPGE